MQLMLIKYWRLCDEDNKLQKTQGGTVTSCWKLSDEELAQVLSTRKIYLQILTFNKPLQPIKMMTENPVERKE